MTDGVLPFSDGSHSKLNHAVFPTLRREDKHGEVGDLNTIAQGETGSRDELGTAKIVAKETVSLDSLNHELFKFDTGSENWDEAFDSLCSHYDSVIEPDEDLTLIWSVWTQRYD